jgi:uncharacterized protein YeaO (DUF488 family)
VITVKSVHDQPDVSDGVRILVDRTWPRGTKTTGRWIHEWRWDLAPTTALRKWFRRDPTKWEAFKQRYRRELEARGKIADLRRLAARARDERVTLLFTTGTPQHNSAAALQALLEELRS